MNRVNSAEEMTNDEVQHIITRIKKGDENAFSVLINEYKAMVFALCLKMTRNSEDAEEIAQDVFVKAYAGLRRFKGKSKFSTWLYRITYFTAINFLRKRNLLTLEIKVDVEDADSSVLTKIEAADRSEYLQKAMSHLKAEERALITLFHLEEQSVQEIMIITKLSASNIKVKLMRTRKKLYSILVVLLKDEAAQLI